MCKRLSIFFFYDKDGVVRDYVIFYLKNLKKISSYLFVVVNGILTEESRHRLETCCDEYVIRENKGFDVWAYRFSLDYIGWNNVRAYEQLVLCNFTCYGPIYPFEEMFSKMAEREVDFWGAVKHPEQKNYLLPNNRGWINEHIMSYFIVINKNMLRSDDFYQYWVATPLLRQNMSQLLCMK